MGSPAVDGPWDACYKTAGAYVAQRSSAKLYMQLNQRNEG